MSFIRRLTPLFDRVVVQRVKPMERTSGGIVIPESQRKQLNEAKVVSVGKGVRNNDGKFIPMAVSVGDYIMLPDYRGDEITMNGNDYIVIRESDILAKVEQTNEPMEKGRSGDIPDLSKLPDE